MLVSAPSLSQEITPFLTTNQNPFISIYGLPTMHSLRAVPQGYWNLDYVMDITNNSFEGQSAQENMIIDGETYRFTMYFKYGLSKDKELGIIVPFVSHTDGIWDGFIKEWHDLFGLTNSRRNNRPNNQLRYQYVDQGITKYNTIDSTNGIGDVRVYGALRFSDDVSATSRQLSLQTEIKLPTGKDSSLHGSGSVDIAVSVNLLDDLILSQWRTSLYGAVGVLLLGESGLLSNRQRDSVSFGHVGADWRATNRFHIKLQIDAHTSFYNSDMEMLGSGSLQGVMGGSLQLGKHTILDAGVVENLSIDSAPDVVFHIALKNYR